MRARRQWQAGAEVGLVDLDGQIVGAADFLAARTRALEMMNRTVAFHDPVRIEAGSLELPVDIAGEHKTAAAFAPAPGEQTLEAALRKIGAA